MASELEQAVSQMEGWCTPEKAQVLYNLVKKIDSVLTVELGVFGGRSLVPMAMAHKEKSSGIAIGIDPWKKEACLQGTNDPKNNEWWANLDLKAIYLSCQYHIEKNGLEGFCETLRMTSKSASFLFRENSIDIIHQDSNHNTETITSELELWIPKLKIGGYWVADDVDWPEALDGYSKLPGYGLELFEDYHTWQIWKKIK